MAMTAAEKSGDRLFRLAGEDAPVPVALAFAALGFLLATVASAQFMDEWRAPPPAPPAPASVTAPVAEPPKPEAKPTVAVPAPAPAPAPEKPAPAPVVAAAPPSPPAQPVPPPETAPAKAPVVAANPAPVPSAPPPPTVPFAAAPAAAPAAVPAPAPEPPPPAPCLPVVSIPFQLNSARLKVADLDAKTVPLRDWLLAHQGAIISVEGHADATGPEAYNVLLSYKRAETVAAWLINSGAPAAQIATRAAGVSPPVHWTTEMQSNRQVILQIEGVEACRDDSAPARQP